VGHVPRSRSISHTVTAPGGGKLGIVDPLARPPRASLGWLGDSGFPIPARNGARARPVDEGDVGGKRRRDAGGGGSNRWGEPGGGRRVDGRRRRRGSLLLVLKPCCGPKQDGPMAADQRPNIEAEQATLSPTIPPRPALLHSSCSPHARRPEGLEGGSRQQAPARRHRPAACRKEAAKRAPLRQTATSPPPSVQRGSPQPGAGFIHQALVMSISRSMKCLAR
jgi:hypothetical protein